MRFLLRIALILGLLLQVVGCAPASTVFTWDKGGNDGQMSTVFAHGVTQQQADTLALGKAKKVCLANTARVVVIAYESIYSGLSAEQKDLIMSAGCLLPSDKVTGSYRPAAYNYRSIIKFTCEYDK